MTLDNNLHADVKVLHQYTDNCGAKANQCRVFTTEFEELQKEYAVFIRRADNGDLYTVALLGLDKNENLFLDGTSWSGRYIPATFRRGPFQIGRTKQADGTTRNIINIDLDDERVNEKDGNALFLPSGGLSPYLQQISKTLETINIGLSKEKAFYQQLEKYGLLKAITVQLPINESKSYTIPDIYSIDQEKLLAVKGNDLQIMHQSGFLLLCQWIITSLGNTNNLLERKIRQSAHET